MTEQERAIMRSPDSENALQPKGSNYLFVVGIDDYKHHNVLNNAVSDAKSLKNVLTKQYDFHSENVVELYNGEATNKSIMRQLRAYEALTPDDNLLFFYSGHGFYRKGLGYLVPVDAEDEEDFILNSSLRDRLSLIHAKHITLIFDACFSGSFVLAKDVLSERLAHKPSRWALAAGNIELVSDGIAGRNSPFTKAMLDVLKDFEDDEIGVQRLFIEARDKTILRGATQTPIGGSMKMEGNEGGEFVFHRRNIEAETWLALNKTNKPALRSFIEKYPNGTYTPEAKTVLKTIETQEAAQRQADEVHRQQEAEKQAFHNAKNSSDPKAALSKFVLQYPNHSDARTLLADVQVEAAWKKAKRKGDLTEFEFFQEDYPNSKYSEECQKRIEAFKESEPKHVVPSPTPVVVVVPEEKSVEKPKTETPLKIVDTTYENEEKETFLSRGVNLSAFNEKFDKHFLPLLQKIVFIMLILIIIWGITNDAFRFTFSQNSIKENQTHPFENEMVYVQGGTFDMGDNFNDGETNEKPVHSVTLSDFYIGKYELTVEEFASFITDKNYKTDADKEGWSYIWTGIRYEKKNNVNWKCDVTGKIRQQNEYKHPVIHINWNDATAYCQWLSKKTGKKYCLPTEAQWEYAARGGNQSKNLKYSGSDKYLDDIAWYSNNSNNKTHEVGTKKANELGLHDMNGNVLEWCQDWYDADFYKISSKNDPICLNSTSTYRVLRGGSWINNAQYCRSARRLNVTPGYCNNYCGFRLVFVP